MATPAMTASTAIAMPVWRMTSMSPASMPWLMSRWMSVATPMLASAEIISSTCEKMSLPR